MSLDFLFSLADGEFFALLEATFAAGVGEFIGLESGVTSDCQIDSYNPEGTELGSVSPSVFALIKYNANANSRADNLLSLSISDKDQIFPSTSFGRLDFEKYFFACAPVIYPSLSKRKIFKPKQTFEMN